MLKQKIKIFPLRIDPGLWKEFKGILNKNTTITNELVNMIRERIKKEQK